MLLCFKTNTHLRKYRIKLLEHNIINLNSNKMKPVIRFLRKQLRFSSTLGRRSHNKSRHLQDSTLPTYHFQSRLKVQPIPALETAGEQCNYKL